MALIYCPECKSQISDTTTVCPNCGYPYEKRLKLYQKAYTLMNEKHSYYEYLGLSEIFHYVSGIADAAECEKACLTKAKDASEIEKVQRLQELEKQEEAKKESKKTMRTGMIILGIFTVVVCISLIIGNVPRYASVPEMRQAVRGTYVYNDHSWRIAGNTAYSENTYAFKIVEWNPKDGTFKIDNTKIFTVMDDGNILYGADVYKKQ